MAQDHTTRQPRSGGGDTVAELRARETLLAGEVLELKAELERLRKEVLRQTSRTAVLQDRDDRLRRRAEKAELRAERLVDELKNAHVDARAVCLRVAELEAALAERDAALATVNDRLSRRAHELKVLYDSRSHRVVQWVWRVSRRVRRPFQRLKRPARPLIEAGADAKPAEPKLRSLRDQADEPPIPAAP